MTLDWNRLDPDEQRVMYSAIEHEELLYVYMHFVPASDANHPNRAHKYIPPLMKAAQRLVGRELVTVVPTEQLGPPRELPADEALEVVSDFNNWWRYRPDDTSTTTKMTA